MAAARQRVVDRARHREHLAVVLGGEPRRDQRTAGERRLDHQRAEAEAGDHAVAARKLSASAGVPSGTRDQRAAAVDDRVREIAVGGRIDAIEAGAEHGQRAATGFERAAVRGRRRRRNANPLVMTKAAGGELRGKLRRCRACRRLRRRALTTASLRIGEQRGFTDHPQQHRRARREAGQRRMTGEPEAAAGLFPAVLPRSARA